MYLSYDRLWQTLNKKSLKKTDLLELTGISSRTLAKLSANESVTVDTLAKICDALNCKIEDVITLEEDYIPLSLYDAYKHTAKVIREDDNITLSETKYQGKVYNIYMTKKRANKWTQIYCTETSTVEWRETPFSARLSGFQYGTTLPVFKEKVCISKDAYTVFVINGSPNSINNLDEGLFRSAKNPGNESNVHVMSMARFKTFTPQD